MVTQTAVRRRDPASASVPAAAPAPPLRPVAAAPLHAALADPTREAIVRLLAARECAVGEIAAELPVSRPAVSKHLRLLESAGLVRFRSEGTRNVYALEPAALAALRDDIDALWRTALARLALDANNRRRAAPRRTR
ncbi:MAG: helix-turn-helix transcriptional regulator [Rubrivivax sp.]|nr:helix-turn-helix transcriptional regulator [Rubrivivax sp.]MCL4697172.1 helix-turn-helix domain-containing protein [Burkholderiaceae bacterium]